MAQRRLGAVVPSAHGDPLLVEESADLLHLGPVEHE